MAVDAKKLVSHCNEKTIAVVAILGNHYNGVYDPVWDIDAEVQKLNEANGWQVGIHVDGASGGFIAPFQTPSPPPFDFRLPNVMSISSSGHKFGESICGTGWVVFRERKNLAEHIAVSVTYLGGQCDSITLNFSRPASGPYVQYYKLLRLGRNGYSSKVSNQMSNAAYIRNFLRELKHPSGKPRFQILDGGDDACLPVVAARLNPDIELTYDDIDLQHALSAT
jgi:glutamate decarboxylase